MRDAFYLPFPRRNGLCLIPLRHSLCAKSPVCCGLSPCKRGRYASVAFPTFWGTPSPSGKTRIFRENDTGRGFPQALLKSRPGRLPHKMGRLPLERVGERMDRPNERLRALSAYSARRRLVTDSRKNDDPPTGLHRFNIAYKSKRHTFVRYAFCLYSVLFCSSRYKSSASWAGTPPSSGVPV